jgi:Zn-dependent M28 family amino/carboxypeptidase
VRSIRAEVNGVAKVFAIRDDRPAGVPAVAPGADPDLACARLVCGESVVKLLEVQRERFPHRTPGFESYVKAQGYFADYFRKLGYEVEVDPFGTDRGNDLPGSPRNGERLSSYANVVAYKRGTTLPDRFIGFGGHYDVVENTTEGAFDNTGGAVSVLEMARAFKDVKTKRTIFFALWGGEEDGYRGSAFWTSTNPAKALATDLYVNLDVAGLAWPAPRDEPDPIVVTAGPDGPIAERMIAFAREVRSKWTGYAQAPMRYEPVVVGGQVGGSRINAQSDHTPFAAKGVPVYFLFTGDLEHALGIIHRSRDSLENLTEYALRGAVSGDPLDARDRDLGRSFLARSYETQLWLAFYFAALRDADVVDYRGLGP